MIPSSTDVDIDEFLSDAMFPVDFEISSQTIHIVDDDHEKSPPSPPIQSEDNPATKSDDDNDLLTLLQETDDVVEKEIQTIEKKDEIEVPDDIHSCNWCEDFFQR